MEQVIGLDGCAVVSVDPERVRRVRDAALTDDGISRVSALFKMLGDPTRTRLLYALLEAGELCVCDLAASIDTAETTVSQALRLMRTAGIVDGRRAGRNVFYRLSDAHVRLLLDVTREHALHGSAATAEGPR